MCLQIYKSRCGLELEAEEMRNFGGTIIFAFKPTKHSFPILSAKRKEMHNALLRTVIKNAKEEELDKSNHWFMSRFVLQVLLG